MLLKHLALIYGKQERVHNLPGKSKIGVLNFANSSNPGGASPFHCEHFSLKYLEVDGKKEALPRKRACAEGAL